MVQDKIKMNGAEIWQPDKDMGYSFETTYTEGSTRSQAGEGHFTPMFTVEQYSYKASNVPIKEAIKIIRIIAKGSIFTLHHFSLYHGVWRDDHFLCGKSGNLTIGSLSEDKMYLSELSFNMTGKSRL